MESFIGFLGILISIGTLAWTIYTDTRLKDNSNSVDNSINNNYINKSKTTTTINKVNTTNYTYINKTSSSNKSSDDSQFDLTFMIICFVVGSILYSKYSRVIIFSTSLLGIVSLISSIICSLLLIKRRLLPHRNYIFNFISYMIIFICILFVSKPLYNYDAVSNVENLLRSGSGFLNVFSSNSSGVVSLGCKIGSVGIIISYFIMSFKIILVTYKSIKNYNPIAPISWNYITASLVVFVILLLFSTGYFVSIFDKLRTIKL